MDLSKSIDFLLENAGPVIQHRLRKEILKNLSPTDEENLLEQIYQSDLTYWAIEFLHLCDDIGFTAD